MTTVLSFELGRGDGNGGDTPVAALVFVRSVLFPVGRAASPTEVWSATGSAWPAQSTWRKMGEEEKESTCAWPFCTK